MEITKGECIINTPQGGVTYIKSGEKYIATVHSLADGKNNALLKIETRANAALICEAFNVANETGFSPRQLAEQNKEYLYALKMVKDYIDYPHTHKGTTVIRKAVEKAINSTKI